MTLEKRKPDYKTLNQRQLGIAKNLYKNKFSAAQMPTGTGKSRVLSHLLRDCVNNGVTWIVSPSNVVLNQNEAIYKATYGNIGLR